MSRLAVTTELLASAAAELENVRSAAEAARAAAAGPTTGLAAAGADEISVKVASLFSRYGREFQVLIAQASAFHLQFVQGMNAATGSYLAADALNASALHSAPNPAAYAALIMGGTGDPLPNSTYLDAVYDAYIAPLFGAGTATGLTTPEQGWPLTGLNSLTFDTSVARGVAALEQAITAQSGTSTVVFGFSQSATIVTDYLQGIANGSIPGPPLKDVNFVLAGDPNNPNGGLFERFVGLYLPGFNETFSGATPDLGYRTNIYTIQYDGYADFPRYPLDVFADANAIAGLYYDHLAPIPAYQSLTAQQLATALVAPVSPGTTGQTTYSIVPSQNLPLLEALHLPQPLLNLIQPDLRVLVDMGYGDVGGPDTEYANLPTPASLFELINPITVGADLVKGAAQGVQADLVLAGVLPQSDMPDTYPFVPSLDPGLTINLGQPSVTALSAVTTGVGSLLRLLPIPPFGRG